MQKRTFAVDIDGTITENGGGRIHLDAREALRRLTNMGHNVIFVTGRSSVEGHLLSVFGGTGKIAVSENGGCITLDSNEHILLGHIEECKNAFQIIKNNIENVKEKHVFPRMTEVVLERTFDLDLARKIVSENNLNVELADSQYAFHINSSGINKGTGFYEIMNNKLNMTYQNNKELNLDKRCNIYFIGNSYNLLQTIEYSNNFIHSYIIWSIISYINLIYIQRYYFCNFNWYRISVIRYYIRFFITYSYTLQK